jgi:hypothetical protein
MWLVAMLMENCSKNRTHQKGGKQKGGEDINVFENFEQRQQRTPFCDNGWIE